MRDKLAVLNVTNRCNHACVFCSEAVDHDQTVVPFAQVAAMFRELRERHYTRINFMGGETTLRKDFFELLDLARSMGFLVGIATNGTRFANPEFAAQTIQRLSFLELSLVTPVRADYVAITGQDHQPRLLAALEHIMALRRQLDQIFPLTINVVVCSLNRSAPLETVRLLAEMELPKATFLVLVRARCKGHAQQRPDVLLDAKTTAESFRPALELARERGVPTLFRGLPTCSLVEFVGHNNDAVDAVLQPSVAYMNRKPIYDGIDIEAHHDGDISWRRRMAACRQCHLGAVCQGLDDDLPDDLEKLCDLGALPAEGRVRAELRRGPMGVLLTCPADAPWPPPL